MFLVKGISISLKGEKTQMEKKVSKEDRIEDIEHTS